MRKNAATGALDIAHGAEQFFELEPRISSIADISVVGLANIDSTNMTTNDWEAIVATIQSHYEKFDGFVVTMGTNTMAYASSAVSFAAQKLGKPVVFTGAQIPAEAMTTDARNNLVNALRIATMDLAGVFVVFGSRIMLGCRAKKMSESEIDAFGSFNDGDFGELSIGIRINREGFGRHDSPPIFRNGFDSRIACLTCIPGMTSQLVKELLAGGIRGIILRGYGSGDIPAELESGLEKAREHKVPVIVTTQCRGSTVMGLNDPGFRALQLGAIQAFDMSMEAMSTKLMWMLRQDTAYEIFKSVFHQNLVGEINIKRTRFFINEELKALVDYRDLD